MHYSIPGNIAKEYWLNIPQHFSHIELNDFVIMPNHIHGIIILNPCDPVGTCHGMSLPVKQFGKLKKVRYL